jgi:hypothetical protein
LVAAVILCKICNRRHADGTEWCVCNAYLPFDGEHIEDEPVAPPPPRLDEGRDVGAGTRERAPVPTETVSEPERATVVDVDAVLPDRPVERQVDRVETPRGRGPGDVACPVCGTDNSDRLRFCSHCGEPLTDQPPLEVVEPRLRWWQRIPGVGRRRGAGASGMDPAGLYRSGLTWRSRVFRVGAAGGLCALAFVAIHPTYRPRVIDAVKQVLPGERYREVTADSYALSTDPPEAEDEQRPAAHAADGHLNTSWATQWSSPDDPGPSELSQGEYECPPEATGGGEAETAARVESALVIAVAEPTDVTRLRILPGRWADDPARESHLRPNLVEVRFVDPEGTARCDLVQLEDSGEEQLVAVTGEDARRVELRILSVHGDLETLPSREVALTEVRLQRER